MLEGLVEKALRETRGAPGHELSLPARQAVWAAMGPRIRPSHPWEHEGHRRRALLAISSVERVLPFWKRSRPGEHTPQEVLADAVRSLDDSTHAGSLMAFERGMGRKLDQYWFHFQGLGIVRPVDQMVAFAAVRALGVSLYDEQLETDHKEPIEIEEIDAAAWAAMAEAGGAVWNPASDPAKRLAFWEWYLTEAVPAAYRDGSLPPRSEGDS